MKQNFWDENAQQWTQLLKAGSLKSRQVTSKAIVDEVNKINPTSLLDIGCGQGWLAQELEPAIRYMGIDGSEELIKIAEQNIKNSSPQSTKANLIEAELRLFEVVDYEKIKTQNWSPQQSFDVIVFNFSILDDFSSEVLSELKHHLNPNGRILIQTLHPCFQNIPYIDSLQREDFKMVSQDFNGTMLWKHRTLGTWFTLFKEAQLYVDTIQEPLIETTPASIIFSLAAL